MLDKSLILRKLSDLSDLYQQILEFRSISAGAMRRIGKHSELLNGRFR
jgi:hypothetical protein